MSIGSNLGQLSGVSSFPWPDNLPFTPREMDEKDIEREIEAYGKAAEYVKKSGLDGVNLLASHGELLTEFLSPVLNKRKDGYGGSLEGRLKW